MKKNFLFAVVIASLLAVAAIARTSPNWASALRLPSVEPKNNPLTLKELGNPSQRFDAISINEDGIYYLGGICSLQVEYKRAGLRTDADIEVPVEVSRTIPYRAPNDLSTLFLPGCHIVHFAEDKEVDSASSEDGQWTVCFGERPDVDLVVYYYLDSAESKIWIPLPTSHQDGLACASAFYSGEYAPANEPPTAPAIGGSGGDGGNTLLPGSIQPPTDSQTVNASGSYSIGGVCNLIVEYKKDTITDSVHVQDPIGQDPVDWDTNMSFPVENGLLYLPGCHVIHYEDGEIVRWEQTTEDDGQWTICFAALPDKEMSVYYFLGDLEKPASDWIQLESTVENGKVCAPAQYTGMYAPAGK